MRFLWIPIASLLLVGPLTGLCAQGDFSPAAYMQFMEEHEDYTAAELLADHPPRSVYYSDRQHLAELAEIPWFDSLNHRLGFTADEKELLGRNLFMVSERLSYMDWASAFITLYSNDLPLFLSTDFILSTLHNSYDAILETLEWQLLEPNLKELLKAMHDRVPFLVDSYGADARLEDALNDVDLYISVARSLAEGKRFLPRYGSTDLYQRVMEALDREELAFLPLFTSGRLRKLDFSQFTPRGHYDKEIYTPDGTRTLEDYFRAMMWLGRIDFLLTAPPENPWETEWTEEELRRMQLGALLLNECLYGCGKTGHIQTHERIISYLVGPDDNLSPRELRELTEKTLEGPADLFEGPVFTRFTDSLDASDDYGQKIMSNFFLVDPFSHDPGQLPVSFKLLGQKFLLDSYVFSEVVFDRIVYEEEKIWRALPDPLDVMAALGNEDALALLATDLDTYKYAANMAGLKYLIDAYDPSFWSQSLYNTWLGAIRALNPAPSAHMLPYFMQTTAWHQEKLNTQLTSWAQLRHDNILYGKQSYTGGTGCSYPYTYVEPYPELYATLEQFARRAADFFGESLPGGLESKREIVDYYNGYGDIMENLRRIAQKELERVGLSDAEVTFLKTMIHSYMASGPSITGWYNDLFYDSMKALERDFTVADVHTQPTDRNGSVVGNVLHVGNGMINLGVFVAGNPCNPGQRMAFAGPVSSFHRKVTPDFKRLTDREWEEMFAVGEYPERPDWVAAYLADQNGGIRPSGRTLEGEVFTGTWQGGGRPRPVDYLLLFPNPATGTAHARFVLNEPAEARLSLLDVSGRIVSVRSFNRLPAGEHDVPFVVEGWVPGLYLLKMELGQRTMLRQLVVR